MNLNPQEFPQIMLILAVSIACFWMGSSDLREGKTGRLKAETRPKMFYLYVGQQLLLSAVLLLWVVLRIFGIRPETMFSEGSGMSFPVVIGMCIAAALLGVIGCAFLAYKIRKIVVK